MQAVIQKRYGSPEVLELKRVDRPVPGDNELLVRVHATTVTATEAVFRRGKPYFARLFTGFARPKIETLGEEFAGEVVATGKKVKKFSVGEQVFGTAGPEFGAAAEFFCASEDEAIVRKPDNVTHAEAASSVDGFLTALPFLRDKGEIRSGLSVLINGASGSVGSAAVQIAKYYGTEVTGVSSGVNVELVKSLGADHVIDYTREDFSQRRSEFDIIFDAVGKTSFRKSRKALRPQGIFLEAGMNIGVMVSALLTSLFRGRKARIAATGLRSAEEKLKDLHLLQELLERRSIVPTIDRTFPLDEIRAAHSYVDTGRKKGNVVVSVASAE
jgi:NADPH:quinone reductase-like Zn-dependent oxidoreductase